MVLVAVLVGTGVLFGFVALAVDGGSALLQRRTMQNAADAAALGAAKVLADNIVWGPDSSTGTNKAIYLTTDAKLKTLISEQARANGVERGLSFTLTVDYGNYSPGAPGCSTYCWHRLAIDSSGTWTPQPDDTISGIISGTVDAIRVRAAIQNATIFARVIGVNSVEVSASAAAALVGDPGHAVKGPTWPMTSYLYGTDTADYLSNYGLCKPTVFYSQGLSNSTAHFQNLMSLSQASGCSFTQRQQHTGGTQDCSSASQLDTQLIGNGDQRASDTGLADRAFLEGYSNRRFFDACAGKGGWQNQWSPHGSCSHSDDPLNTIWEEDNGTICCRSNPDPDKNHDVSDIDVANWILWDFEGGGYISPARSSLPGATQTPGETDWLGLEPPRSRQDFRPNDNIPGDWLETYLSTNRVAPGQVVAPVRAYINDPTRGSKDLLADDPVLQYGPHVDKVMYLYKEYEVWAPENASTPVPTVTGTPSPPVATPTPYYQWVTPVPASTQPPDRVHMVQPLRFRFYRAMAQNVSGPWSVALHPLCGVSQSQSNDGAAVMAIIVGETLDQAPSSPGPHGLYNYIGFVDANQ
jgi:hypothetical protein